MSDAEIRAPPRFSETDVNPPRGFDESGATLSPDRLASPFFARDSDEGLIG
jgi:hypothetical protein